MKINPYYSQLPAHYLFHDIDLRVQKFLSQHPDARLLRMGIGDVTRPLPRVIVDAMQHAAEELAHEETFRGYCPENGYEWLRQTIIDHFFLPRGIPFHPDEVFISEGAGSDLGNLSDLFDRENLAYYKETASIILNGLREIGLEVYGGENAPYIWCRAPHGWNSWTFFDHLLNRCQVVSTPGVGFGQCGEDFVRFSAFANRPSSIEALRRIMRAL